MPLYMKMSQNINETTRHLKFRYISILTIFYGLTMNEKCKNYIQLDQLKKIKRTKML